MLTNSEDYKQDAGVWRWRGFTSAELLKRLTEMGWTSDRPVTADILEEALDSLSERNWATWISQ